MALELTQILSQYIRVSPPSMYMYGLLTMCEVKMAVLVHKHAKKELGQYEVSIIIWLVFVAGITHTLIG